MGKTDCGHYVAREIPEASAIVADAGAPYRHLSILKPGAAPQSLDIIAKAGADVSVTFLIFPGADVSFNLRADLVGAGASVNLYGLYICGATEHVGIQTDIRHIVPGTFSNQIVNGVAGGSAKVLFDGRIVVAPDAQKTEAFQTNRNIILTDGAKVETKPQLEIYADDVKCSHGATIGRLDDLEQFYMRSRGIPEDEAKFLQLISFLSPVLADVPEGRKEELAAEVEAALRSIL
ncbi:MAG: SufD family Fe-S cluster assembly protein [Bacteroidales bacterium]|nr:SufD family Fe-S cluster assembly protein [Bacteroidales bacterium]